QSSGYGKSRTFTELGAALPVFYSSLQDNLSGFPPKSFYLNNLIVEFDALFSKDPICYADTACAILYAFILRIIFLFSKFSLEINKTVFLDEAIDAIMGSKRNYNFDCLFSGLADF